MNKSNISQVIEGNSMLVFKPNSQFYEAVNINKKRWGSIYRGSIIPTYEELGRIAQFFKKDITEFYPKSEVVK